MEVFKSNDENIESHILKIKESLDTEYEIVDVKVFSDKNFANEYCKDGSLVSCKKELIAPIGVCRTIFEVKVGCTIE